MKTNFLLLSLFFLFISCQENQTLPIKVQSSKGLTQKIAKLIPKPPEKISRDTILRHLKAKINRGEALFVHVFVPLCDNENQGIVPVPTKLGNGLDLRSNLYWGARYGVKSYFKLDKNWTMIYEGEKPSLNVLERVIFKRKYTNGPLVYLIADAYRGDRMGDCLKDFNASISGVLTNRMKVDDQNIMLYNKTDLLIFNGHNGLMDTTIQYVASKSEFPKDVAVIACISNDYFIEQLQLAQAYPLLLTTNLLAPEAYVLSNAIDAWAALETGEEVLLNAAKGYNQYQKCGLNGARRLFQTGW